MGEEVSGEEDYLYLPEAEASAPSSGLFFQRYAGFWWAVRPGYGLVFYNPVNQRTGTRRHPHLGRPQCNSDERIKSRMASLLPFSVEVRQFPLVFVQISLRYYS